MKKRLMVATFMTLMLSATAANACPKGTHPTGGIGPHHKGGTCKIVMTSMESMT